MVLMDDGKATHESVRARGFDDNTECSNNEFEKSEKNFKTI